MEWVNELRAAFDPIWLLYAAPVVVGAIAFWLGRRTAPGTSQVRAAEAELEATHKELERRSTELEASREALEGYRASVTRHFEGTSERLHELTVQYRDMYEHLSEGARALCPDGFRPLEGGLGLDALPPESGAQPSAGEAPPPPTDPALAAPEPDPEPELETAAPEPDPEPELETAAPEPAPPRAGL